MSETNNKFEAGIESNALRSPQRVVFITPKTSAKVRARAEKQFMSYPQLILRGVIAFEVLTILLVIVSLVWDAPLEQLANPLLTPNPAKAPWYFLGLQELLHFFPPFVAGILIPTLVVIGLVVIPYFNVNIEGEPIWAPPARNLRIVLITVLVLLGFLAFFDAWTILVPTALVAALLVFSYTARAGEKGLLPRLARKPISWWVMTWFIAVALCLTV